MWRPIPGLEQFEASDEGEIRAFGSGQTIRQSRHGRGYRMIYLSGSPYLVHRLVAIAFLGPIPAGEEVNHRNGIKTDNAAANLEYLTRSENNFHAYRTGLKRVGQSHPQAKLSNADVTLIRNLYKPFDYGYAKLGKVFGISPWHVRDIVKGEKRIHG